MLSPRLTLRIYQLIDYNQDGLCDTPHCSAHNSSIKIIKTNRNKSFTNGQMQVHSFEPIQKQMPPNVHPSLARQQTSILTTDASLSDGRISPPSQQTSFEETAQQLFFVTSYSDFDKLAHGPRGHAARHTLRVYQFDAAASSLVLLHVAGEASAVINPAFSRFHPR